MPSINAFCANNVPQELHTAIVQIFRDKKPKSNPLQYEDRKTKTLMMLPTDMVISKAMVVRVFASLQVLLSVQ